MAAITDRLAQVVEQPVVRVSERAKGRHGSSCLLPQEDEGALADVWVQKAVDVPMNFGEQLVAKLRAHGVDASIEAPTLDQASLQLRRCQLAIFLLSEHFFEKERAVALLRCAVNAGRVCVIVKMPGAAWGEERDIAFPENAFNPSWDPYLPELGPAFAEIAVTWEVDYPAACELELMRRVAGHLERRTGNEVVDISTVTKTLVAADDAAVDAARRKMPADLVVQWDWSTKVFDVFLSHKITDAKDIVLTWYNALAALDYHPFLDRLSLDMVDNIPTFVEETVTFLVALTSHLFESYWCGVELCRACELHGEGKINILLVPVQGEHWSLPDTGRGAGKLSFPTPEIVMKNFPRWFPELPLQTSELVARLYGGGEYTESRIVQHTLFHYKSFERLLIARCGMSIKVRRQMDELVKQGGATLAEQSAAIVAFVAEANALRGLLKSTTQYEAVLEKGGDSDTSQHADLHRLSKRTLMVAEVVEGVRVATYSASAFSTQVVLPLRLQTEQLQASTLKLASSLEQWYMLQHNLQTEGFAAAVEALLPVGGMVLQLIGYLQITASFGVTFADIGFPPPVLDFFRFFGFLNFDFFDVHWAASVASGVNFPNTTLLLMFAFGAFLLSVPLSFRLLACCYSSARRRQALWDRAIRLAVFACFLAYPALCARLIKLYRPSTFSLQTGQVRLLSADTRIDYDAELLPHHAIGALFIVLYITGIPVFFAHGLWSAAKPAAAIDLSRAGVALKLRRKQRLDLRYGMLFSRYEPRVWWWELFEMARKCLLISVLEVLPGGSEGQLLAALGIALLALLAHTACHPFVNAKLDALNFASLLSTLLTLFVGFVLNYAAHDPSSRTTAILLMLQLLPLGTACWLVGTALYEFASARRHRAARLARLPAVLHDESPDNERRSSSSLFGPFSPMAMARTSREEGKRLRERRWTMAPVTVDCRPTSASRGAPSPPRAPNSKQVLRKQSFEVSQDEEL